ncbi:MAG: NAD(P)/FAD-dependent oxidoreductase [Methanophagales archaeon]|nr:NAD(P)/FAD-dependent oxidoreductase [Methanophagales archaeon]
MKEEKHDVVVVGAGPAGSITAKTAAERGVDVLLIERNPEIGEPVRCAEGVSKEIERFVKVDSRWICAEVKGTITYGPDGTKVILSVEGAEEAGYVLERKLFDKFLAQEAAHAGAEVRVKTQAYGVIQEEGYVKGVYARSAEGDLCIYADVVVGADGVESRVGRWGGIDTTLRLADVATCAQFLMCDIEFNRDYCELFFGYDTAPRGYAWVFPKGENCANVGVGIGGDVSREKHRAYDYLNAFVQDKFPDGKIIAEMYGAVPLSGPVYETVANGLILVGDAARHVNPITGGGILEAMQGGEIAGDVIAKAVHENNTSKRRLKEYEKRWRKEFGKVLKVGLKTKNIVLNLSTQDLNKFFHSLAGGIRIKEFSERALLKEMIKKNPRMLFSLVRMKF